MNWIAGRKSVVRSLLFSVVFLFAVSGIAAAQEKKPSSAPSKPAAAPKPAAPAAHPSAGGAARPSSNSAARPGSANTARPGAANTARPGAANSTKPGAANATRPGATTANKAVGAAAAKPGAANATKAGGPNANKAGGPNTAKTGGPGGAKAPGTVTRPGGGKSVTSAAGHTTNFNAAGKRTTLETKGGTKANFDRSGRVSTIHTKSGMTINHGAHGERRFETRRRDGGRVVGYGHGRGFAEHGYYRGGHPYMRRSYYYGGRSYAYAYRGYYYGGYPYYGYVPAYYYAPAYYGWAYNPWPAPVAYGWGWGGAPWYGYYGYYFAPAPVYPYPALWLTDYLLAANLQAAYEAQAAAEAGSNFTVPTEEQAFSGNGPLRLTAEVRPQIALWLTNYLLTPGEAGAAGDADASAALSAEVKQQLADEVKAQIAAEKEAAEHPEPAGAVSSTPPSGQQTGPDELPAALDPKHRLFIVSTVLSSSTEDGTECSLSAGDVIKRLEDTPDADKNVKVLVASSQKNDCTAGSQVSLAVQDIQEMHNDFRAKISEGLGKLAENQGKNGLPSGPTAGKKPNPAGQAQPDLTVESDLKAQEGEASQAEKEVQEASSNN